NARVAHVNPTSLRSWAPITFAPARLFGAVRARDWPVWRRAVYALGSPLIPALALARMLPHWRRARRAERVPLAALPLLTVGRLEHLLLQLDDGPLELGHVHRLGVLAAAAPPPGLGDLALLVEELGDVRDALHHGLRGDPVLEVVGDLDLPPAVGLADGGPH